MPPTNARTILADRRLQALKTGHGGSLATMHATNAPAAPSRLATCAMQAGDPLAWTVVCRDVIDGSEAVIHQTRTLEGVHRLEGEAGAAASPSVRVHPSTAFQPDAARGEPRCRIEAPSSGADPPGVDRRPPC
ncbi:MAG: hypothetical protein OXH09_01160 [Gammaproteobacteria bacterium]|nr:hypothetical protein [Gammaproteobacteria bacterium]